MRSIANFIVVFLVCSGLAFGVGRITNSDIVTNAAIEATKIANGAVSNTEFQYLDGVTSAIQSQINALSGGGSSGVITGTIDSQAKSADGMKNVGSTIYMQSAEPTFPGLVSTGSQTFAGTKTFSSTIVGSITGNSGTSTALQANPADCGVNAYATSIAANGDLTCASITNGATTGTKLNDPNTLVLRDPEGTASLARLYLTNVGTSSTFVIEDQANDATPTTVNASGDWGIGGAATTSYKVGIYGAAAIFNSTGGLELDTAAGAQRVWLGVVSNQGYIYGYDSGNTKDWQLLANGDSWVNTTTFGVGTTTPSSTNTKFHVVGGARFEGKIDTAGTAPTLGSGGTDCGTTPSVVGTDTAAKVTIGTSPGSKCTVTFNAAFTNAPICIANNETSANLVRAANISTTAVELTGTLTAADKINVICMGRQ